MKGKLVTLLKRLECFIALAILPFLGIALSGKNINDYLEFPPYTLYVEHAPFSWIVFILMALFVGIVILPFIIQVFKTPAHPCGCGTPDGAVHNTANRPPEGRTHQTVPYPRALQKTRYTTRQNTAFPWWGWSGLLLGGISWFFSWTRFSWFTPFQLYTFTPLWLSYIIVVNALTYKKTSQSMLTHRPKYFLGLFFLSAIFWWYFEILNRFVQNWYYLEVNHLAPLSYFFFATLAFSTVLPAVLGTYELLKANPNRYAFLDEFPAFRVHLNKNIAWVILIASCLSLVFLGIFPDTLYPLLWLSPLIIITSWQVIRGQKTIFDQCLNGRFRKIILLSLSALICGFFWEMWNYYSLAKWVYTVPFVQKFKIFEMPLLGYAGYLPFGLECACLSDFFFNFKTKTGQSETIEHPGLQTLIWYAVLAGTIFFLSQGSVQLSLIFLIVLLILPLKKLV